MVGLQVRNWSEINISTIMTGKTDDGVLLLSLFLKDYKETCKPTEPIVVSCGACLERYYKEYLKTKEMSAEIINSGYELHKKYEGITLFGSGLVITNKTLSDEIAKRLLKDHPRGEQLFSKIVKEEPVIEAKKEETPKAKRKPRAKKSK